MKQKTFLLLLGAAGAAASLVAVRCAFSAPRYEGPPSGHFDGERFHNLVEVEHGALDFWKWQLTKDPGEWRSWVDAEPGPPPPRRVSDGGVRVTFVNHATLLIQLDGLNILTDPIWSERCSPVSWAGPRRHRPPGIRFEDLPPIDLVLISHNHYDHLDLETLRRLEESHRPGVRVGLGNGALLEKVGLDRDVEELDWWDRLQVSPEVSVSFVPAQHFSARGVCDRNANLWGGWMITGRSGRVYFAGDSGWGPHFEMIRNRLGVPDIALLPIGAFRPKWFMSPVHISPQEAIDAHRALGASTTIPMHYGTFHLGDDGETEAVELLRDRVESASLDAQFRFLGFGEAFAWLRE
ncbi:MAG: MBL fold metallo-hydrolase [Thermoanaerobaculia bacterium]|nr:MBL fold metallo-hydrolase [Thermoanaerobaculia bacterium]